MARARLPRGSDKPGGSAEDREHWLAVADNWLLAGIRALRTGQDWAACLEMAARLPGHDFANIVLIAVQRPEATSLAGRETWKAQGRPVRRGEPGILVFAGDRQPPAADVPPLGRHHAPSLWPGGARAARLAVLWDIAQTTGAPAQDRAARFPAPGRVQPGLWESLTWLARREGLAVEREFCGPANSAIMPRARRIRVRPDLDDTRAAQALLHQLSHVLLDGTIRPPPDLPGCCRGVRRIEADSVGFLVSARLGLDLSGFAFPGPAAWAGSDPRAHPETTIVTAGTHITTAAAAIVDRLAGTLPAAPAPEPVPVTSAEPAAVSALSISRRSPLPTGSRSAGSQVPGAAATASVSPEAGQISRVLRDAESFYLAAIGRSWVPGYLAARGLSQDTAAQWRIGHAPGGWTTLLSHLRGRGHDDAAIQAAGLARRSARGTLIDHFRDRVMLAIRDDDGTLVGFIGRARPDAGPAAPKYLNSPQTAVYVKGRVLFGLHEARERLAGGAMPVVVEGPFDAIAVSAAEPSRYAGLAPCGTAFTAAQAAALARVSDVRRSGVLVALDGDRAGQAGILRAYDILLAYTDLPAAVILPADSDPARILERDGPAALGAALQDAEPLARVVIDAHLDGWAQRLDHAEGQLNAARSAAALIAGTLPAQVAAQIRQIAGGREIALLDESLRAVAHPELPVIARLLPPGPICQIIRVAERTSSQCAEITAEAANAIVRSPEILERTTPARRRDDQERAPPGGTPDSPSRLAAHSYPARPAGKETSGPARQPTKGSSHPASRHRARR